MPSVGSPSILAEIELETYPDIMYPTLEAFIARLDDEHPSQGWGEWFYKPLVSMWVRTLNDMLDTVIISPESLFVFHQICPFMIMDFFVHVAETLDAIHDACHPASQASQANYTQAINPQEDLSAIESVIQG
ncbi:hypothetical protein BV22DRAFT_1135125 [Leucogyrophana mollusca]|uniref:Uncharacterized protein n=1 Tax=Leucogyrophana mollusca TaxID=85980 RepID=A0ACB8AY29_9AGAM|nr:hypothetical protein BV22DRAFT_1135125 [Leucogyrophana mollusca]